MTQAFFSRPLLVDRGFVVRPITSSATARAVAALLLSLLLATGGPAAAFASSG